MLDDNKYAEIRHALHGALTLAGCTVRTVCKNDYPRVYYPGHVLRVVDHDMCDTMIVALPTDQAKENLMGVNWLAVGFFRYEKTKQIDVFVRAPKLDEGDNPDRPHQRIYTGVWLKSEGSYTLKVPKLTFNGGTKVADVVRDAVDLILGSVELISSQWQGIAGELHAYNRANDQLEYFKQIGAAHKNKYLNAGEKAEGTKEYPGRTVVFKTNGTKQFFSVELNRVLTNDQIQQVLDFAAKL